MNDQKIIEHLEKLDLKFKKGKDIPKFCDQKTQIDVVECVSLCILNYKEKIGSQKKIFGSQNLVLIMCMRYLENLLVLTRNQKKNLINFLLNQWLF